MSSILKAGEKYTKVSIPFSNLVKLSKIEACIKDQNGKIIKKLRKSDIKERSAISDFSLYEDHFVKEFILKHNVYPYTIEYSYQIRENQFLSIANWIPLINEKVPCRKAVLGVSVPKDYPIAYKNYLVDKPATDTAGNSINFRWQANYTDIVKEEEYAPPILEFLPGVKIRPLNFYFDKSGSFNDWVSYGNWQYDLLQDLNDLPNNEKKKIKALVKNTDSDKEKIKALYHYLQDQTRYINISIETGGLKPYPASYVVRNKFGDCKALTNYFKSMLDYLGIESYYTNIYAGNSILKIDKDFPFQQANHAILYIPLEDEAVWTDCTSKSAFNYAGTFTQNRNALIITKNDSRFIKTPALKPDEVLETRKITIRHKSGTDYLQFSNKYRGKQYESISSIDRNYGKAMKDKIIRKYIIASYLQLVDYQINLPERDSAFVEFSVQAKSHNIYKSYGRDMLVNNIPFSLPKLEKIEDRKLPLQFDYPIYKIDTITYEIPQDYKAKFYSEDVSISNKYGEYKTTLHKNANNIVLIKKLLVNSASYPLSEYKDFYNFYHQIIESENKPQIILIK